MYADYIPPPPGPEQAGEFYKVTLDELSKVNNGSSVHHHLRPAAEEVTRVQWVVGLR